MTPKGSSPSSRTFARLTFAERVCGDHGQSADLYIAWAWRYGANTATRVLRPLIILFSPSYFEAEELHLARVSECRWRHHIVDELDLMRVSPLRRGIWRRLGVGINAARLLKYYDHLVALEVIENDAVRIAESEARTRSGIATKQQLS